MGRIIIIAGFVLIIIGIMIEIIHKIFGKLPGDMVYQKGNITVFVPLTSMILLSVIATVVLNIIFRIFK